MKKKTYLHLAVLFLAIIIAVIFTFYFYIMKS